MKTYRIPYENPAVRDSATFSIVVLPPLLTGSPFDPFKSKRPYTYNEYYNEKQEILNKYIK